MLRGPCCGPVILPKSGLVTSVTGFARPERLKALNASARNSTARLSRNGKALLDSEVLREEVWSPKFGKKRGAVPSFSGTPFGVSGTAAKAAGFRY